MSWELPRSFTLGERAFPIRSDYRAALDICAALADPELDGREKVEAALWMFYPEAGDIPPELWQTAVERCFWFLDGGGGPQRRTKKAPRLVDWEQDFPYICGPVNRVLGFEVRAAEYLHWWTFLAAYMEIGDCTYAQIIRLRDRLARGKPLSKEDRLWYRQNRHLVDFERKYTQAQQDLLKEWSGS